MQDFRIQAYPREIGTVEALKKNLMEDGFVFAQSYKESVDGHPPGEGFFRHAGFWLMETKQEDEVPQ